MGCIGQIFQVLVDQAIGADFPANLLFAPAIGNQFVSIRHVDAVDIRKTDRGSGGCKINLLRPRVPGHLNDLGRSIAPNYGIVH